MDTYDVIIIGTGAGGGTLAHHLAPSGKKILLLERGDWLPRELSNWLSQDVFVENRYVSEDTWYDAKGKPFQPQVHYFVGGATKLYGAALYRLRKEDFGELQHHDGLSPAWPISYEELEPYYTKAEELYQVHGARGEDPTEPAASGEYPHPAVSHEPRIQQLSDDLAAAGYHPFHAPCGIMLDETNLPYSKCVRCANRRLPLPRPRQVGRRGDRGASRARAPECHAAHEREGGQAGDERGGHRRDRGRRRA
jgi:choline dehydrogenase-like flavoprotein